MKLSTDMCDVVFSNDKGVVLTVEMISSMHLEQIISLEEVERIQLHPGQVNAYRNTLAGGWLFVTKTPTWGRPAKNISSELLAQCYHMCLNSAEEKQCTTVSFPLLGVGGEGFSVGRATKLAVLAVREYLYHHPNSCIEHVVWHTTNSEEKNALDEEILSYVENVASGRRAADIHAHIVWGVDDGSIDEEMSFDLLRLAYEQGVRRIAATSHGNAYTCSQQIYNDHLSKLIAYAKHRIGDTIGQCVVAVPVQFSPHERKATERACKIAGIKDVELINALRDKRLHYLGNTKKALIELSVHAPLSYNLQIVESFLAAGQSIVIAHAERYHHFCEDLDAIATLVQKGCEIQVNAYSLSEEANPYVMKNAQALASRRLIHFLGTDAHRTNHRPPSIQRGLQWLYSNADSKWVKQISFDNASQFFI